MTLPGAVGKITKLYEAGKLDFPTAFKGRTLGHYSRENLPDLIGIVQGYLFEICQAYKVTQTLNEYEAAKIAKKIIQERWSLKLAMLPLFVDLCKSGSLRNENGEPIQVYGRVDESVIFEWIKGFELWQAERLEEQKAAEKIDFTPTPKGSERLLNFLKGLKTTGEKESRRRTELDDKQREESVQRAQMVSGLFEWFPREIDTALSAIGRMGITVTTEQFLKYRKIKLLIEKMKEAKRA